MSILIVRCEELSVGIVLLTCCIENILISSNTCQYNIVKCLAYFSSRRIMLIGVESLETIVHPLYSYYIGQVLISHHRSRILRRIRRIFIRLPFNFDLAVLIKFKSNIFIGIRSIILSNCVKYLYMIEIIICFDFIRLCHFKTTVEMLLTVFISCFNKWNIDFIFVAVMSRFIGDLADRKLRGLSVIVFCLIIHWVCQLNRGNRLECQIIFTYRFILCLTVRILISITIIIRYSCNVAAASVWGRRAYGRTGIIDIILRICMTRLSLERNRCVSCFFTVKISAVVGKLSYYSYIDFFTRHNAVFVFFTVAQAYAKAIEIRFFSIPGITDSY